MFRSYLKVALRNLRRQRLYSLINVGGLAIGMASALLILLWVKDELSYDRFHEHADRLYRIIGNYGAGKIPAVPGPLTNFLKAEIPEVVEATRLYPASSIFEYENAKSRVSGLYVEPQFLKMFSFRLVKGDPETALSSLGSVILTEKTARRLFADEDPMGKLVSEENERLLKVTGIVRDPPENCSPNLRFDYLYPFEVVKFWKQPDSWQGSSDFQAYLLLTGQSLQGLVEQKMADLKKQHFPHYPASFFLQPLTHMHLYSDFKFDAPHSDIRYVVIFVAVAFFVLAIACINFMNLSTARFSKRAKEVGLRKVVGANRAQLIRQFLSESVIFTLIAFPSALLIVELLLPVFNSLSGKQLTVDYKDYRMILGALALLSVTGFISGIYPALFLSSFRPIAILQGHLGWLPGASDTNYVSGGHSVSPRKALVTFQFVLTIGVITGTLVISEQVDYLRSKYLGYDKENLVYANAGRELGKIYPALKRDLMQSPNVAEVTASTDMITYLGTFAGGVSWEGQERPQSFKFQTLKVNDDFDKTYGLELAHGRFFSRSFPTDQQLAFVINEEAVRAMGLDSPIGKTMRTKGKEGQIIGIVKDFHFRSLHEKIAPLILELGALGQEYEFFHLSIRLTPGNFTRQMQDMQKIWEKHLPHVPFDFHLMDSTLDRMYTTETRLGKLFGYFALLTILVSCLGLFGLATFMAEQRTKEIGIRKVLGASVFGLVALFSREFVRFVLIAGLVASPIVWLIMRNWLTGFEYQVSIGPRVFVIPVVLSLLIAVTTVSIQAVRAALRNPTEALRYE